MQFIHDDGGRAAAGYKGDTRDCVTRSIAIATGKPYQEIYDALNELATRERIGKRKCAISSARDGVRKATSRKYILSLGWVWTPTMHIGSGCTVHLHDGELPSGRLIVCVSKHLTAVIDGVIHDTHDPQRAEEWMVPNKGQALRAGETVSNNGAWVCSIRRRCVYGYFTQGSHGK